MEFKNLKIALADTEVVAKIKTEENEKLLAQLHQLQDELECYYLDLTATKEENDKLKQQLDQLLIVQKQLIEERDAAGKAAYAAEAAHRKQADNHKQVENQMIQEREATQKAAFQFQEERKSLLDQISRLQKQRAEDLKRLEEAVVIQKQFLQERDSARKVTSETEHAFKQLAEKQEKLQKQLDDANTIANFEHEENIRLLADLHQVQEELESYYLANRQMLTIMEQSEVTMDRAYIALIRLSHG